MEKLDVAGRIVHFDWIRGCMILWMLIYHISLNYGRITFGVPEEGFSAFTLMSFFMATFYVGSGYFFSGKKEFKKFLSDKLKKIGAPYVTYTSVSYFVFLIICLICILTLYVVLNYLFNKFCPQLIGR